MAKVITAKVYCASKVPIIGPDGASKGASLSFYADYRDGTNDSWKVATPSLSMQMTVNADAAEHFENGQNYTLSFVQVDSEPEEA